ncbi:High mobility group B protein 4 [Zea mays]|uniref:High mobility group B protein 4 n=1 Tax=Zea mays TaxID=4577 RepID=A0A1D6KHG4_MAIZE|nr:High mobility group B protein 4 [Zea mays]
MNHGAKVFMVQLQANATHVFVKPSDSGTLMLMPLSLYLTSADFEVASPGHRSVVGFSAIADAHAGRCKIFDDAASPNNEMLMTHDGRGYIYFLLLSQPGVSSNHSCCYTLKWNFLLLSLQSELCNIIELTYDHCGLWFALEFMCCSCLMNLLQKNKGDNERLWAAGIAGKRKKVIMSGKPKRPPSAFFVFMSEFRQEYQVQHPGNKSIVVVSKTAGEKWHAKSD